MAGGGNHGATREVNLSLKHGVEAKNYDDVNVLDSSLWLFTHCVHLY